MKKYILGLLFLSAYSTQTFAQDRLFAYTYQTNVLNKGDFDLEFQNTLATGKVGMYSPYIFGQHLNQRFEFEFDLGYMHFCKPEISFGFEVRNNNDITKEDGWINSILFLGPAFHASIGKFFTNISELTQLTNLHKTDAAPGSRDLNNYEQVEV